MARGPRTGVDPLGIQANPPAELAAMKACPKAAHTALLDEGETSCCAQPPRGKPIGIRFKPSTFCS